MSDRKITVLLNKEMRNQCISEEDWRRLEHSAFAGEMYGSCARSENNRAFRREHKDDAGTREG